MPIQEQICNTKDDNLAALNAKKDCKSAVANCKSAEVNLIICNH